MNRTSLILDLSAVLILVLGTLWLETASDTQLLFMLKPVAFFVGLFSDKVFVFQPGVGFCEPGGVVISKACSGMGFLLIHFAMLVLNFNGLFVKPVVKWAGLLWFLFLSYIVALIANVSRIIGLVYLIKTNVLGNMVSRIFIHKAGGLMFYLFFLAISYLSLTYWQLLQKAGKKDEPGI